MLRRTATALLTAAAVAGMGLVTAAPAMASPDYDRGDTQLRFDAGPEPIRKGHKLSLSGKLDVECSEDYIDGFVSVHHADSCDDRERRHVLGWKEIDIFFQPSGQYGWRHVESVRTGRDGSFYTRVSAYRSGTWRAVFDGARGLASAEASDYVRVIRDHHHWR
ncbi:hypothetical protein [Streptosporangium sp. KLBMP 9127]|nr:hypothetical protein [Streptosporangium sp. KLBMP 9127]